MTTENIPQLAQLRGQARRTAQAVRDRAHQVQQELAALDGAQADVQVLAATLTQNIDDDRVVLAEEGEQLASILGNGQPAVTPLVAPTTPLTTPVTTTVVQPAVVAPAATPAIHPANPRDWTMMQWICAVIGALVALLISLNTRGWFASLADIHGFPDWLFRAGWIVALTVAGFCAGGLLVAPLFGRRARNNPNTTP